VASLGVETVDKTWLITMFKECGLEGEEVNPAVVATLKRLLRRERPEGSSGPNRPLIEALVRDPIVSLNRIIGRGDAGLPFVDDESGRLNASAIGHVLGESGLDPAVAMSTAKVIAEAYEPKDLYQPVWEGLGNKGSVDLDALRKQDWSPLRAHFPEFKSHHADVTAVTQAAVSVKPKAKPPGSD
ncbi:MAG: hypothetical protein AAF449_17190, partial [Myxococcota bacterium]